MTVDATVQQQLDCVVDAIYHCRYSFIRVVLHLQREAAAGRASPSASNCPVGVADGHSRFATREPACTTDAAFVQVETLAQMTTHGLYGKRKRSMTHFDGIPLCIIQSTASSHSHTLETRQRRTITARRIRQLDRALNSLSLNVLVDSDSDSERSRDSDDDWADARAGAGDHVSSARSSGSFVSTPFGYDYASVLSCGLKDKVGSNAIVYPDDELDYDLDSDDEEDVVFLLAR
ncbi:hypothetical protein IAU60_002365 [Kwoniella sp. DSM 27419]